MSWVHPVVVFVAIQVYIPGVTYVPKVKPILVPETVVKGTATPSLYRVVVHTKLAPVYPDLYPEHLHNNGHSGLWCDNVIF